MAKKPKKEAVLGAAHLNAVAVAMEEAALKAEREQALADMHEALAADATAAALADGHVPDVDVTPTTEGEAERLLAEAVAAAAALGDDMAAADELGGDYLARGRALGILPPVQAEGETGAAYDARCEAFEAPAPVLAAWKRALILRAALRKTAAFALFVEDESTGKCRNATEGDSAARVRAFTPTQCYLMDTDTFKALPGKASDADTVKGRVAGSREGMQAIGNTRYNRSKGDAREDGRIVEAATGTPSRGARGGNKTLEQAIAAFAKKGATMAGVRGTDKGQAFKSALVAFVDRLTESGVIDADAWKAARAK